MDTSGASTSTSGNSQHASLLQTVIDLKADLERTMQKMQVMEEQNLSLTQNYNTVKDELVDTRHKYNEARENYLTAAAEKTEIERNSEMFLEKLKVQLAEKTKEFEAMRDKFAPQDLDFIRIKVQEELEVPHKQRIQAMEMEVQKHKDSFFAMRRELETAKAEYEAYSINQANEVRAIREEHDAVQTVLREQIARLQDKDALIEKDDQIRSKNIKLHELQLSLESALKDSRVLQTERDEARKSLEDFRLKHHTDMESMKTKTVQAESARQGMEGRVAHLITENEKKDSAIRIAQTSASDADVTADQAKRELAQIESQMNNLRIELNKDSEDAKIQAQAERAALLQQVDMANIKIRDRDETVRKLTRDIVEIQTRAETNESEIRRAHLSSVSGTRKRLAATELGYQDSIGKVHSTQKTLLEEEESHKAEMNSVRSELDRIRREKEALHDKLREAEHTAEGERRKIAVVRREAAGAKETHLVEMGEERERSKLLEATKYKVVELEAAVAALRGKLDDATSTNRSLSEDAVEKLRLLKESFTARVSGLDIEVRKEKKRADAYKSKALEAHNRAKYSA